MRWNRMPGYGTGIGCKDCPDRHRACQDTCEKLIKEKERVRLLREKERQDRKAVDYIIETAKKAKIKRMKKDR